MTSDEIGVPEWVKGEGPDADVVISTRGRLARGLAGFPFPSRATGEELSLIAGEVRSACSGLAQGFPGSKVVVIEGLSPRDRGFMLDARIASVEQSRGGEGRVVIVEPSGVLSVMVNEEDHLRIQAVKSGLACREAWDVVDWADDILGTCLDYAFDDRLGYLTASVSNVGTGLRIGALMHLGGLALAGRLRECLSAAYELEVSVRGMFGEGSAWVGDIFQGSNEITLGISEEELVQRVRAVADYLLGEERRVRKELLSKDRKRLIGNAERSLKRLSHVMAVRSEDAIAELSSIRLAASLGLMLDCPLRLLNEILVCMRVGSGNEPAANIERAGELRCRLSGVGISAA